MNATPIPPEVAAIREALPVVAHASTDWMRSITETELALIPNAGKDGGRRDRCRLLYRIPLVKQSDADARIAHLEARLREVEADARRYEWLRAHTTIDAAIDAAIDAQQGGQ